VLASCAIVFVPVFFAGIVFATTFRDSRQPDIDIGSNIAGAMAGGLSEPLSLMMDRQPAPRGADPVRLFRGCWGAREGAAPALPG